ncbi:MAG: DUF1569 domain-containing protein [Terriglobales bacterium]
MGTSTHLGDGRAQAEIQQRISRLHPDAVRLWGVMSVHQMLVHLRDTYDIGLGRRKATPVRNPLPAGLMRWLALRAPVRWPKNTPTMVEVKQGAGGTTPVDFERDRAALELTVREFAAAGAQLARQPHPFFGALTAEQWLRWGYLHADHHLRQFSA